MQRFLAGFLIILSVVTFAVAAHADDRGRDRGGHDRGNRGHEWNNNHRRDHDRKWDNHHSRPPVHYYKPRPPKVVYVYPRTTYREYTYGYGYYPSGYVRTYTVGGYLPRDRYWRDVPPHMMAHFPRARHGERWVYYDRDAVLISEATSRIISGIFLAASIN